MAKHFLKVLIIFLIMIALGMAGVFILKSYNNTDDMTSGTDTGTQVAK